MREGLVLAHRGWTGRAPENTLESLQAAHEIGCDGAEFDVRLLRDGTCVLHHDDDVRVGGVDRPLRTLTAKDLAPTDARPTTLAEVLAWAAGRPGFWLDVEIKAAEALGPALALLGGRTEALAVTSFDLPTAVEAKRRSPKRSVGWISDERRDDLARIAHDAGLDRLVLHRRNARAALVADACSRGLEVWAWGVDWGFQARRLAAHGVGGFITDAPRRLLRLA